MKWLYGTLSLKRHGRGCHSVTVESSIFILGGRVTLINSILDSFPTYVLSLFPIPSSVGKKLDKLRRDFLWKGNKEGGGYNLVKWDVAHSSKNQAG